jgi:hypothetical protein
MAAAWRCPNLRCTDSATSSPPPKTPGKFRTPPSPAPQLPAPPRTPRVNKQRQHKNIMDPRIYNSAKTFSAKTFDPKVLLDAKPSRADPWARA